MLTLQQVAVLVPHLRAHPNGARWLAAVVLGIRQGEALGLAWDDVDHTVRMTGSTPPEN